MSEKQCWNREFSVVKFSPPQAIIDLIETNPNVFDDSWHNDICPHLSFYDKPTDRGNVEAKVELWWDAIEAKDREYTERPRYLVVLNPLDDNEATLLTDNFDEALAKFNELIKEHTTNG